METLGWIFVQYGCGGARFGRVLARFGRGGARFGGALARFGRGGARFGGCLARFGGGEARFGISAACYHHLKRLPIKISPSYSIIVTSQSCFCCAEELAAA